MPSEVPTTICEGQKVSPALAGKPSGRIAALLEKWQIARYMLVGVWNTLFGYACYAGFVALYSRLLPARYLPLTVDLASITATPLGVTMAFFCYKFFVFGTNFGPLEGDARPVAWIADRMTHFWGHGASWALGNDPGPHEASYLKLDASRARTDLGWTPKLRLESALELLVQWYRAWQEQTDMHSFTLAQIARYESLLES